MAAHNNDVNRELAEQFSGVKDTTVKGGVPSASRREMC
jgi:hypothetical protein